MTGHELTFFEIDPAVEQIARDRAYFHYLEDCRARWRVVRGDARLSMGREADGSYGLIVLDAFSGDAIPVHLLTREALRTYLAKLADEGLIALHISNDYLDLEPAVRELARDAGLVGLDQDETTVPLNEFNQGRMASHWVVLARRRADLSRLAGLPGWRPLTGRRGAAVWTDDYSDPLGLLRW
jgi:spermidine synthase